VAKYYVTMTDTFLSGWGMAEGKTNKLVIECDSRREAEIVANNARARSDMKHVNICANKPSYSSSKYYVSWHDKSSYPSWFIPNYF
jgi:hypothetical protein